MKRIFAIFAVILILTACAAGSPTPTADPSLPAIPVETSPVRDHDDYAAAFARAEEAVACFTGYAAGAYAEGTRMIDGVRYDRCAYGDSLADLRAPLESALDATLLDALTEKTVADGRPLYVEADGMLWRFGGYVAQYGLDGCTRDVTAVDRRADGVIEVTVAIASAEFGVSLSHVYTCVADTDGIRFTGEFPLPIALALAAAS